MRCILPRALEAKEGAFLALEEEDGSGMHWDHHLPSRHGKERTDASTAEVPNHCSSKQIVCSSTPGGSSERLNSLPTLGLLIHALYSPQQHLRPRKGHSGPWRRGMTQGSTGANIYQVELERIEEAYVAESW